MDELTTPPVEERIKFALADAASCGPSEAEVQAMLDSVRTVSEPAPTTSLSRFLAPLGAAAAVVATVGLVSVVGPDDPARPPPELGSGPSTHVDSVPANQDEVESYMRDHGLTVDEARAALEAIAENRKYFGIAEDAAGPENILSVRFGHSPVRLLVAVSGADAADRVSTALKHSTIPVDVRIVEGLNREELLQVVANQRDQWHAQFPALVGFSVFPETQTIEAVLNYVDDATYAAVKKALTETVPESITVELEVLPRGAPLEVQ